MVFNDPGREASKAKVTISKSRRVERISRVLIEVFGRDLQADFCAGVTSLSSSRALFCMMIRNAPVRNPSFLALKTFATARWIKTYKVTIVAIFKTIETINTTSRYSLKMSSLMRQTRSGWTGFLCVSKCVTPNERGMAQEVIIMATKMDPNVIF